MAIPPGTTVSGPLPIAGLPAAGSPLTGNEVVPADLSLNGPTAKISLTQLATFFGSTFLFPEPPSDGFGLDYARQVGLWTNTPTFLGLTVGSGPASEFGTITIDGPDGNNRGMVWATALSTRWFMFIDGSGESTGNAGSNLTLERFADNGTVIDAVLTVTRSNGLITVGALATTIRATSGTSYSVAALDQSLIINAGGTFTLTLPAAASCTGRLLRLKSIAAQAVNSASSNVVPLAGGAAGTAILAATAGKFALLQSDGTSWQIMAAN